MPHAPHAPGLSRGSNREVTDWPEGKRRAWLGSFPGKCPKGLNACGDREDACSQQVHLREVGKIRKLSFNSEVSLGLPRHTTMALLLPTGLGMSGCQGNEVTGKGAARRRGRR